MPPAAVCGRLRRAPGCTLLAPTLLRCPCPAELERLHTMHSDFELRVLSRLKSADHDCPPARPPARPSNPLAAAFQWWAFFLLPGMGMFSVSTRLLGAAGAGDCPTGWGRSWLVAGRHPPLHPPASPPPASTPSPRFNPLQEAYFIFAIVGCGAGPCRLPAACLLPA